VKNTLKNNYYKNIKCAEQCLDLKQKQTIYIDGKSPLFKTQI